MIKLLLKNRINSIVGTVVGRGRGKEIKNPTRGRKIGAVVGLLVAFVVALVYLVSFQTTLAKAILPELPWLYYGIFTIFSFALTFFLSIFETKSELFECRDNNLLLSMPIKSKDILASRLIIVIAYNFLSDLLIMIPAVVIYGIYTADAAGIVGGIIVALIIPFLTSSLSSGVGYIVAKLSKKFKNKTMMSVVFFLVFFGAYMFFVDYAIEGIGAFIEELLLSADLNAGKDTIVYKIGQASLLSPLNLALFVALTVVVFVIAFIIISLNYSKLISTTDKTKKYRYVRKSLVSSSTFVALIKKEFKRLFSSSTYLINSALGVVMPLFICGSIGATIYSDITETEHFEFLYSLAEVYAPLVASAIVIFGSMTYISACSLSLEGKAFWHNKAMPVSTRVVLLSKSTPQILISLPFTLVMTIAISIILRFSFVYSVFVVAIPVVANVFFAFFGVFMNALFPRFDYESEAHVVKRSAAASLTMLSQMLVSVGVAVGTYFAIDSFVHLSNYAILFVFIAVLFVYILLAFLAIMAVLFLSARKIDKMNV